MYAIPLKKLLILEPFFMGFVVLQVHTRRYDNLSWSPSIMQCSLEFRVRLTSRGSKDSSLVVLKTILITTRFCEWWSNNQWIIITCKMVSNKKKDLLEIIWKQVYVLIPHTWRNQLSSHTPWYRVVAITLILFPDTMENIHC